MAIRRNGLGNEGGQGHQLRDELVQSWNLFAHQGLLYFSPRSDGRLWRSDGTAAGTVPVTGSSQFPKNPRHFCSVGYTLLFTAESHNQGGDGNRELWTTDGTASGTRMVLDINGNSTTSSLLPRYNMPLAALGDSVYFSATDKNGATGFWKSDGTTSGTTLLEQGVLGWTFKTGVANGRLFFSGENSTSGSELWVTDGTATGTKVVKEMMPGNRSGHGTVLWSAGNRLYFQAYSWTGAQYRWGIYETDGTATGTKLTGVDPSYFGQTAVCDGHVYFNRGNSLYRLTIKPGTTEVLGQGCGKHPATLRANDPVLGQPLNLEGRRSAAAAGFLAIGVRSAPVNLFPVLKPNCGFYVSLSAHNLFVLPAARSWSIKASIPNDTSILGLQSMTQGVFRDGANPLDTSNALLHTVGR